MSEDHERANREISREPEVIELFKRLVGAVVMMRRNM
jgi:hypothetical protein